MDKFIPRDSKIPTRACLSSSAANLELVLKARKHQKRERAFLCDCHCKTKSVSTHSMQNNPTLLQRSESAVTTQHPFPLTGLVPSGQMWTEDAILSSSPLTPRVTAGTTKTHPEKAGHTPGRWDRRKQLNRYVQQCCFLFFHSSTLPRSSQEQLRSPEHTTLRHTLSPPITLEHSSLTPWLKTCPFWDFLEVLLPVRAASAHQQGV